MSTNHLSETAPLLATDLQDTDELTPSQSNPKVRGIVWGALTSLFLVAVVLLVGFQGIFGDSFAEWLGVLPKDPILAALAILDKAPVIVRGSLLPCNGLRP
jgi:membrane dipeptidase